MTLTNPWLGLAVLGALLLYIGYLLGSRRPREPRVAPPQVRAVLQKVPDKSSSSEPRGLLEADRAIVRDLIVAKRHILAVKEVRDRTGCDLRTAKEIVDDIERRLGLRN